MITVLATLTRDVWKFQISCLTFVFIMIELVKEFKVSGRYITITTYFIVSQIYVHVCALKHA